jgi:DNA-binding helix-hairpin-helix protein with protein kinase domain
MKTNRKKSDLKKSADEIADTLIAWTQRAPNKLYTSVELGQYVPPSLIENGCIPGIGPNRAGVLLAYGMEKAADIREETLGKIPGVGLVLTARLLEWRKSFREPDSL